MIQTPLLPFLPESDEKLVRTPKTPDFWESIYYLLINSPKKSFIN